MELLRTRDQLSAWRNADASTVALVPTMGALHDGHLSHLAHARQHADRVVVSIFVNPTQFGPGEDFEQYPRDFDQDAALCEGHGASAIFVPEVDTMYPPGVPAVAVDVPQVAAELEGAQRPAHFAGVCRVVMKLLGMVRPDVATFGRKDYQQLTVLKALVADLAVPVEIVEVPTTREADGLAMSSRNIYLTEEQRQRALGMIAALRAARSSAAQGQHDPAVLEAGLLEALAAHGLDEVDYAVVRDAQTLGPVVPGARLSGAGLPGLPGAGGVALVACRLGRTRLIDNIALG